MANRNRRNIDWERRGKGEMKGPDGFCAATPNGTAYATGTGWNKVYDYPMPEVEPGGVWPGGRSNRSGE